MPLIESFILALSQRKSTNNFIFVCFIPISNRPDNMATFEKVRIEANAKKFPVLLSNGNLVEEGQCEGKSSNEKRKFAIWSDPFPKPSYL
mmetsp:Transcript_33368/g.61257  ORF Transcript_33368/g.61257 Transcript_33368/m.61257 type:complete len:90 (+) Transcript_33368:35-304(+)